MNLMLRLLDLAAMMRAFESKVAVLKENYFGSKAYSNIVIPIVCLFVKVVGR